MWNRGDCARENRCAFDQACELYPTCAKLDPAGAHEEEAESDA